MCKCGCNSCETDSTALVLKESKFVHTPVSDGLKYHIDNKIPLNENIYRIGSKEYMKLYEEARSLYSRGKLDVSKDDKYFLTETHVGNFGIFEGKKVPLDIPMLEAEIDYEKEKTWRIQDKFPIEVTVKKGWTGNYYTIEPKPMNISYDTFIDLGSGGNVDYTSYDYTTGKARWTSNSLEQIKQWEEDNQDKIKVVYSNSLNESYDYDEVAQSEFGMDYDQLGPGEKEWVQDEVDNQEYLEEVKIRINKSIKEMDCWDDYKLGSPKTKLSSKTGKRVNNCVPKESMNEAKVDEAEFKGKEVALGKPKRGGSKAYYVYVKDGDKVKKVTFGSGGLRAKIKNKDARSAFAARHKCKDKKDRTTAGYWSCNLPKYAKQLGLGANMNTYW